MSQGLLLANLFKESSGLQFIVFYKLHTIERPVGGNDSRRSSKQILQFTEETYSQLFHSCRYVPTAVLSRQTAGLRGKSLILNLPGKPKAIRETIDEVLTYPSTLKAFSSDIFQAWFSLHSTPRPWT